MVIGIGDGIIITNIKRATEAGGLVLGEEIKPVANIHLSKEKL
jgi:hypothetical protein